MRCFARKILCNRIYSPLKISVNIARQRSTSGLWMVLGSHYPQCHFFHLHSLTTTISILGRLLVWEMLKMGKQNHRHTILLFFVCLFFFMLKRCAMIIGRVSFRNLAPFKSHKTKCTCLRVSLLDWTLWKCVNAKFELEWINMNCAGKKV